MVEGFIYPCAWLDALTRGKREDGTWQRFS
jgi:hypothetical protein